MEAHSALSAKIVEETGFKVSREGFYSIPHVDSSNKQKH